jgi:formate dehydrogenase major subunit
MVPPGTSVMRAAEEAGIDIPKLCATDSLKAFGSCRLCLVEVEGGGARPPRAPPRAPTAWSCDRTEPVQQLRRGVMELYLSDHPTDCAGCARGNCEMQALAVTTSASRGALRPRRRLHLDDATDESNPYFAYDPKACIVCSRCVRACGEVQGTFALTVEGRGFDSRITPGGTELPRVECVSCGACVQACPTDALTEKSVIELGMPSRTVVTTCAYCGVGCSFKAEVQGTGDDTRVVRMVPWKDGGANEGHSCVKGRFAYGYAAHRDRQLSPMVRDSIDDEWQVVSWEEAIERRREGFRAIQEKHGVGAIGGISSSRCTNEEVYVVQKMVRAAFGNNNIDTCARVCHSPTGYGLNHAFGTSAGTQDFASVEQADVMLVIGANPTDAHPVFASRMKRRLREGAKIIVADPRRIDLVRSPHVEARTTCPCAPAPTSPSSTRCATSSSPRACDEAFLRERCEDVDDYLDFIAGPEHSPEATEDVTGIPASDLRAAARLYAAGAELGDLLRPRRHRAQPGLDDGHGHGQPRDAHRQPRARGRRRQPAARAEQRAGLVRHGLLPARAARLPARVAARGARDLRVAVGRDAPGRAGPAHPEHVRLGHRRHVQGAVRAGRGHRPVRPQHPARRGRAARDGPRRRARPVPQRDGPLRARLPAPGLVPREGRHLHQRRAPDQPGASGHAEPGRQGRVAGRLRDRDGDGLPDDVCRPSQIMDEIAATTPTFAGVSFARLDAEGSMQWPVNEAAPHGTPTCTSGRSCAAWAGSRRPSTCPRPSAPPPLPAAADDRAHPEQYNVGAQTRRTPNSTWHPEDVLEIHPSDAELRGIVSGDVVELASPGRHDDA